jgi:hypothetical protein
MRSRFLATMSSWLGCAALLATFASPSIAASDLPATAGSDNAVVAANTNPFVDVPQNSWAYQAILRLHDDGLLAGYPNDYFKGNRPITRYEMSVITERVVTELESEMSDTQKATKVNSDDVALVRKLIDVYGADLAQVKKDLATTKAEADASAAELKRANIHVTVLARPGLMGERSTVIDGLGRTANTGQALYGTTFASQASAYGASNADLRSNGSNTHGTGYQTVRVGVSGQINDQLSYDTQLEDNLVYNSANSTTTDGYNSSSLVRLDTADIKYTTPTGWTFTGGRFMAKDGAIGLLYEDYFNGLQAGYAHDKYSAALGYSFNAGSNNVTSIYGIGQPSQTIFAHGQYTFTPHVSGGVSYTSDTFANGNGNAATAYIHDPATGLGTEVAVGQKPQTAVALNTEITVNKKLQLQGEYAHHLGTDPVTGQAYLQPNSFWGKALYGHTKPMQNNNYAEAGFIVSGVNGLSAHNSTFGLGDDYQQFYAGSLDGYHTFYLGAHHYLADNASIGLVYQRYSLNSGVALPTALGNASYNPVAAGTFLSHDQGQALFLETKLSF